MWTFVALAVSWLAKHFTFEVAKYVAVRALIVGVCVTLGPWIIFKGLSEFMQFVMNYSSSYVGEQGLEPMVIQMIGIAAYLGAKLKIAEGVSVYLSFLGVSFALRALKVK